MTDDLIFDTLTDQEQRIAVWKATGPDENGDRESADAVARRLDIDRTTVFRILKRPHVAQAVRFLVSSSLELDTLPRIWDAVEKKAVKDAKFGLEVLKWLQTMGISPFDGRPRTKSGPPAEDGATITIPGGFDAAIRVAKAK
jgi:hypothetical protein